MPVSSGGRYRMKNGVRLHFDKHGKVDEAKSMHTGKTHTPAEFKADAKRHRRTMLTNHR